MVAAVLSGNRNFEGRIHPQVKASYLASPPLVVAYALAGSLRKDLLTEPLGQDQDGKDVFLKDIWPGPEEVADCVARGTSPTGMFRDGLRRRLQGRRALGEDRRRRRPDLRVGRRQHLRPPAALLRRHGQEARARAPTSTGARILALLGDSITTDHISPAGSIAKDSPAGRYLIEHGVEAKDFNSYGARRGNHEVMMRGTFANIRLKNEMADGKDGGWTKLMPDGELMTIYDAAMRYQERGVPLVVIGGKEYGSGSSRDWAAKGVNLLGVKAVIVESFERIHRSNLVGMGVLPLVFQNGQTRQSLEPRRLRDPRHPGHRGRHHPGHGRRLHDPPPGRLERADHAHLPHRHPRRGRLLPPRRHPALRAAPAPGAQRARPPCRLSMSIPDTRAPSAGGDHAQLTYRHARRGPRVPPPRRSHRTTRREERRRTRQAP